MPESLLDKYPHLKLLTKLKKPPILPLPEDKAVIAAGKENPVSDVSPPARISLLGPGVGPRTPLVPILPSSDPGYVPPRTKVVAEDLFAASVAADDDEWLQFQVDDSVPARQQLDQLKMWLMANSPSTVTRSSGVGWIAVKFRDKGKKVLEAKAAWDIYEGEKTMEVVNNLAEEFTVKGGKWLCHLPTAAIDQVWGKLATTLMCGGLGPSVYMVKVSPRQDVHPEQSRGEHVICVYNMDYKDTEQVMRVENLLRSAGVTTNLTYKPDIFSALGIYRNNKWGFRPTIYHSRVLLMEGRSRVEVVGTTKWYFNSSKGLQYPPESSGKEEDSKERGGRGVGKENKVDGGRSREEKEGRHKLGKDSGEDERNQFSMEKIEDLGNLNACTEPLKKVDESNSIDNKFDNIKNEGSNSILSGMKDMEDMKKVEEHDQDGPKIESNLGKEEDLGIKLDDKIQEKRENKMLVEDLVSEVIGVSGSKNNKSEEVSNDHDVSSPVKKLEKQKPAWLVKLEQLQLRSLDEMSKPE